MDLKSAIAAVMNRENLSPSDMTDVMNLIMTGQATDAQIGAFLVALRLKGETVDEIAAAAQVMRDLVSGVEIEAKEGLVDTCGTGGDGANTFNISTASAFVTAAAGAVVAKHGNRSISSKSGSADVLEVAGVNLNLTANQVKACVEQLNVGFMFAPAHHSAMKHAIGPRKEVGVRTVFNVLGPLTNPAGAPNQVMGVYDAAWLVPLAEVLQKLGSRHVMVVNANDGLDEISIGSPTQVAELKDGQIHRYEIQPEDFGMQQADLAQLAVDSAQDSLAMIRSVFDGKEGAARDIVVLNSGAAIYVSGVANSMEEGVAMAAQAIDSGAALQKMNDLVKLSQAL